MATFTSVQTGDWNDGATWGNSSPGVKGTDWPGNVGDVANIQNGTVFYNVVESAELGTVAVYSGASLTFSTSEDTLLSFGNVFLVVNQYSNLIIGTSGAVLPQSYSARIEWNSTGNVQSGIDTGPGTDIIGLQIFGDAAYYGSYFVSQLVSHWEGTSTLVVSGDFTDKWKAGQQIVVHKGTSPWSNTVIDFACVSIGSIYANGSNTEIYTADTPPSSFRVGGHVFNVSRNITLKRRGCSTNPGCNNSLPQAHKLDCGQASNSTFGPALKDVDIQNGELQLDRHSYLERVVVRNNVNGLYGGLRATFNDCIVFSVTYSFREGRRDKINNCYVLGGYYGLYRENRSEINSSSIIGNQFSVNDSQFFKIHDSEIAFNRYALYQGHVGESFRSFYFGNIYTLHLNGKLDFHQDALDINAVGSQYANTYDVTFGDYSNYKFEGVTWVGSLSFSGRNAEDAEGYIHACDDDGTLETHQTYHIYGNFIKDTTVTRSGGGSATLRIEPLSYLDDSNTKIVDEWLETDLTDNDEVTRGIYVMGTGYGSFPSASELFFEAEYFPTSNTAVSTTIVSTQTISADSTWTFLGVTFTPVNGTRARYSLHFQNYESATARLFVDNQLREGT